MTMTKGSEDRLKMVAIGVFVVIAAALFYFEYFDTGSSPTPAPVASAPAPARTATSTPVPANTEAKAVGTTSAGLDPTLHMEGMLAAERVEYLGIGRNIFSPNSAPPVTIPAPVAPARPKPMQVAQNTAPAIPVGPPPPPPIDLKFFGVETGSSGKREAFLLHDDTVYTAAAGDVVLRRYKVVTIDPKSIQVRDMQNNNQQTLPLLTN